MYRKTQEKDQDSEKEEGTPQTIFPKFIPNWSQPIRFDRIAINISGNAHCSQIASMKYYQKLPKI